MTIRRNTIHIPCTFHLDLQRNHDFAIETRRFNIRARGFTAADKRLKRESLEGLAHKYRPEMRQSRSRCTFAHKSEKLRLPSEYHARQTLAMKNTRLGEMSLRALHKSGNSICALRLRYSYFIESDRLISTGNSGIRRLTN